MGKGDDVPAAVRNSEVHDHIFGCSHPGNTRDKVVQPLSRLGGHEHGILVAMAKRRKGFRVQKVYLVEHGDAADVLRMDLLEHVFHRSNLRFELARGRIDDMENEIGAHHFIKRRLERLHQSRRQLLDEPDRVRDRDLASFGKLVFARGRIERGK